MDRKHPKKRDVEDFDDVFYEEGSGGAEVEKKIKKLKSELRECRKERGEYLEGWQRAKADFVNLKKDTENDKIRIARITREDFLLEILPIIDSFDMAFQNKEAWEKVDRNWRVGVENIYNQLHNALKLHGLEEFSDLGKEFNPNAHISVGIIPTDKKSEDDKILEVMQKGFIMGGSVIRPARVKIGKYSKK